MNRYPRLYSNCEKSGHNIKVVFFKLDRHLILYSTKRFRAEFSSCLGRIFSYVGRILGPNLLQFSRWAESSWVRIFFHRCLPSSSKYRVEYAADLPKREVGQIEWKKYPLPKVEGLPKCNSKVLINSNNDRSAKSIEKDQTARKCSLILLYTLRKLEIQGGER